MQKEKTSIRNPKEGSTILNSQLSDNSAKIIFEDPILCAQFLRNYLGMSIMKDLRPEDIEDVTSRYVPLIGEERNSDIVKRVNVPDKIPFFFVSLIEHKTQVEYNVCMQIFRYMFLIWDDYEKEQNKIAKGASKRKSFRYPPILPILYYEGKRAWTAAKEFHERVFGSDIFGKYIPNFTYSLVSLYDYSNENLLGMGDEISLVMLINKLQAADDIGEFRRLPADRLDAVLKDTPDYLLDKIALIFRMLLMKLNVPEEETEELVGRVKEREMGQLFANMEKMDIQEERRKTLEAERKLQEAEGKVQEAEGKLQKALKVMTNMCMDAGLTKVETQRKLQVEFGISLKESDEIVNRYWKEKQ